MIRENGCRVFDVSLTADVTEFSGYELYGEDLAF